jgi:EAL domain-containing protein (putative c-di-GMP-specific phosphodiesterase class I)
MSLLGKTKPGKTMPTTAFDLQEIILGESLEAHFQPIVSLRKRTISGYEGLTRCFHPVTGKAIPPLELFFLAAQLGRTLDLDRLCRKTVLESFGPMAAQKPDCFLSLNFEASVIDQGVAGSGALLRQVTDAGLKPSSIALEIIESDVKNLNELQKFIQTYRDYGFMIALDDVGAGHSNLNRIPLLKPDILKVDRYLVQNIQNDFHKQEVFKSLVGLSHKIGALTLAEGIETQDEALAVMEMGVDMIQGYYFARPQRLGEMDDRTLDARVGDVNRKYKETLIQKINIKKFNLKKYEVMTREVQTELAQIPIIDFDGKLLEMVHFFPLVECFYILDEKGAQVTETVLGKALESRRNRHMFRPALKGEDHSMKDYFYMLIDGGLSKTTFITEPYLSLVTGNICITFARLFRNLATKQYFIICTDINTEYLHKISMGLYE